MRHVFLDVETTGLSPLVHRVVCIGMRTEGAERIIMDEDERKMLEEFMGTIAEGDVLVGYNIAFDIGFLILRSLKHGVNLGGLLVRSQIDIMEKITKLTRGKFISLGKVAACFGVEYAKDEGMLVPEMWRAGKREAIKGHCLADVRTTEELFKKLEPLMVEPATDAQRKFMRSLGVTFGEDTTKTEASRLIDESKKGRTRGI